MMNDVTDIRQTVFEIILYELHIPREVYELRYSLFIRACKYYFKKTTHHEVIEPFPSCFYDKDTKKRRYNELKSCISSIPTLSQINRMTDTTSLPELTWALLHWIFTNPLNIKVFKESEISEYLTEVLREETKLSSIPNPSNQCLRFEITHEDPNAKKIFLAHKAEFGSFFAYHGSPGQNFHSIIHRGLRCSLNVRKAFGPGTYLTSYLDTASSYSTQSGWFEDGRIKYCVAIVEVIKHPSINVQQFGTTGQATTSEQSKFDDTSSKHHRYYVVNSDDFMRLRHLLVFFNGEFLRK